MLSSKWLGFRVVVVAIVSLSIAFFDSSKSNINWGASLLISGVGGICLASWFQLLTNRPGVDWSDPFGLTKPFFPLMRYPTRYWAVIAVGMIFGGALGFAKELVEHGQKVAFSATFLLLGVAILLAILLRMSDRQSIR